MSNVVISCDGILLQEFVVILISKTVATER